MIQENFIKIFENSFKENWNMPALSDYGDNTHLTYGDLAKEIAHIHILFDECKVRRGDKIALIGKNTTQWCITYLASVTYGAIIVPILQDFNPNDVHHIINHSQATFLFTSDNVWETLEEDRIDEIRAVISLNDMRCLHQKDGESINRILKDTDNIFTKKYPGGFTKNDVQYAELSNDKVVSLNYTSGTTGFSKAVMTTGNNLAGNITFVARSNILHKGEKLLSFLPLAHAYGCAFEFLYALSIGAHTTLLGKTPAPKILLKAFEEIKPNIIITVPLIIEKVYKKMILPQLNKRSMKWALSMPFLDTQIYAQIRKKLVDAFGGRFSQVIIGGAPLNKEVEDFLLKIKFPFTVGYGMTECAPLIAYAHTNDFVPTSCGKVLDIMEVRIDSKDPYHVVGEIQVHGENVMAGYYKNEEADSAVFTEDGWLKTGDLGTIDKNNNIFIRGRSKTMILDAGGQNIYPEEIEAKLNNLPFVMESLILKKNGKLIALVYPDYEAVDATGLENKAIPLIMEENRKILNQFVAPYESISSIQLYPTEFEKTPKKSIKRYLYSGI
ncbi:MAG: AMP-binding protein [Dysgonamonadaceae bacterium]|jgi:long-chain acyl-CoA synthetase|nr:AMP-binding protein [Dysgonamonadaceae bacterium]